jgi:hypothetical protein
MKIFLCFLFLSSFAAALPAVVITDGAIIYVEPDFDAEQIGQGVEGAVVEVSQKAFGPFHRIKLPNGKMGYIADNDFQFKGKVKVPPEKKGIFKDPPESRQEIKDKPRRRSRKDQYWGPQISYVGFREDTMAMKPTQNSVFVGAKFFGPEMLFEGSGEMDVNVLLKFGAPEYYQQATGVSTQGWIFHTDFLFQNVYPQTKNITDYLGYGLMLRYSKYDVGLNTAGVINYYDLEDIVLGFVASAAFSYRMDQMVLRGEYKFYWEKMQYWGLGLSLLFPF